MVSSPPVASLPASERLARALEWAASAGMSIDGLLSTEQLRALLAVFSGGVPWRPMLAESLRAFAYAYFRLSVAEGLDQLTIGDTEAALNEIRRRDGVDNGRSWPWPFCCRPTPTAFDALGFSDTSSGIVRVERDNRAGWREHARRSRSLIEQAARELPGRVAAVIGAGQAFDLPLRALVARYDQLILVDIDEAALAATVDRVLGTNDLRARVSLATCDVTGLAQWFPAAVRQSLADAEDAARGVTNVVTLLESFHFDDPPALLPTAPRSRPFEPVDTVYSCMVLSQLATPLTTFVGKELRTRFGNALGGLRLPDLRAALATFTRAVQHAHIAALLRTAPTFVLTSDVTERVTIADPDGTVRDASPEVPLLGVERLDELLPARAAEALSINEWDWPRLLPSSRHRGSTLRVQGLVGRVEGPDMLHEIGP